MNTLLRSFISFFFNQIPRKHLELIRFFFYTTLFFIYLIVPSNAIPYMDLSVEYWKPNGLFKTLDYLASPLAVPFFVNILWKSTFLFCALGMFTPVMKWMCFVLTSFFLGYSSNFYIYPVENVFSIFCVGLLCFSEIGREFSIDQWLFSKKAPSSEVQGWPIRFIQTVLVTFWLCSGIQKLRLSGFDWFLVNHIEIYLKQRSINLPAIVVQLGLFIALAAELLAPFILFKRMKILLLILFFFHVFTIYLMGIPIYACLAAFIFWLPHQVTDEFVKIRS